MQELLSQEQRYDGRPPHCAYTVNGIQYKIPTWAHPAGVANRILSEIQHTHYYGVQIIAPPGNGKTTVAQVLSHHLHTKGLKNYNLDFTVRLEVERDTHAFRNLDSFIKSLPKKPTIVIFDDLSGVFGQMSEQEIDKNFETLTQVRWILDPANGEIPFIPILTYHYSKIVEKKFRSQNGISIFCRFGNEERTNIDTIAPKKTQARRSIYNFQRILKTMFTKHKFEMMMNNGQSLHFETDKPFRACVMISDDVGNVIVTSKDDVCDKCTSKSKKKRVDELEALRSLYKTHGAYGIQQLRQSLANRGLSDAINPKAFNAMNFVENRFLPAYEFDLYKLKDAIYKMTKTGRPKKANRKTRQETEVMKYLDSIAFSEDESKDSTISE